MTIAAVTAALIGLLWIALGFLALALFALLAPLTGTAGAAAVTAASLFTKSWNISDMVSSAGRRCSASLVNSASLAVHISARLSLNAAAARAVLPEITMPSSEARSIMA